MMLKVKSTLIKQIRQINKCILQLHTSHGNRAFSDHKYSLFLNFDTDFLNFDTYNTFFKLDKKRINLSKNMTMHQKALDFFQEWYNYINLMSL